MTPATATFVVLGAAVVAEGLDRSGVTAWLGSVIERRAGTDRGRVLLVLMELSAVLAAVITPNGAAAALLPVAVAAARRARRPSSQFLMSLAFAASAGALLALSGSTVNVIVSEALGDVTGSGFTFFEFAIVGVPALALTMAIALTQGPRLLPHRTPATLPPDVASRIARDAGLEIVVHDRAALVEMGCGGLLGVNRGSDVEPRMVRLTYRPDGGSRGHLGLVGKSIT